MIIIYWGLSMLAVFVIVVFSDLLILLIRYRINTDNWEYPIDMARFREFCQKVAKEKKERDETKDDQ